MFSRTLNDKKWESLKGLTISIWSRTHKMCIHIRNIRNYHRQLWRKRLLTAQWLGSKTSGIMLDSKYLSKLGWHPKERLWSERQSRLLISTWKNETRCIPRYRHQETAEVYHSHVHIVTSYKWDKDWSQSMQYKMYNVQLCAGGPR